ncbi:MAG: hypothetical protein ACRDRS_19690 [Pseudonocardiaceae bacterium]
MTKYNHPKFEVGLTSDSKGGIMGLIGGILSSVGGILGSVFSFLSGL